MAAPPPTPPTPLPLARPPPPAAPPALPTATATSASSAPLAFLSGSGSAQSQLALTGLALLIAGGLIVRTLQQSKGRTRSSQPATKANKKRKQDVVKSILIAQGAGKASSGTEDGASGSGAKARSRSGSLNGATERRPPTLLPSPACITSTSAAFFSGLEKLGGALASTAIASRTALRSPSSTPTGSATTSRPSTGEMPGDLRIGDDAERDDGSTRKSKGRKGKAAATSTGGGSKGAETSRNMSKRTMTKDVALACDLAWSAGRAEAGVQVSHLDDPAPLEGGGSSETTLTPISRQGSSQSPATQPKPKLPSPPSSSDPPATASACVQTSPRLLAFVDQALPLSPPRRPRSPPAISAPTPTRPSTLPLPFNLHASFQSTPPVQPLDYAAPSSPPLSPTPSRSPSIAASVSSGSPTGHRAPSPSTRRTSTSSTAPSSLQPGSSLSSSSSRSRKQARKSSAAASIGTHGKAVVGLPKPAEMLVNETGGGRSREPTEGSEAGSVNEIPSRIKSNGRDRPIPLPIPIPPSTTAVDSSTKAQRRLSTASSAYSTSALSLTSSSPYSSDRNPLPSMPPSMTMTPPDFVRGQNGNGGFDRDEALRWSAGASARGREASLRGLGVEIEHGDREDGQIDGSDGRRMPNGRGASPKPPSHEYFSSPAPQAPGYGRTPSNYFASPESSPQPPPHSLQAYAPPSPSYPPTAGSVQQPWSTQPSTPLGPNLAYPIASSSTNPTPTNASRPPSRQSSLSVPPNLSQQQLHLQQHQQQQAYAIAQVQAQAAVQYQHVVALQLQAQAQAQQNQRQRRRTDGAPGFEDLHATASVANGLVYPLGSSNGPGSSVGTPHGQATWSSASHPASPMVSTYPHLAQAVSPTTNSFGPSVTAAHAQAQAQAQAQLYYSYLATPAGYHNGTGVPPSVHQPHPTRPRINSSVSAVAVLTGGGSSAVSKNGSMSSPIAKSPRSATHEKARQVSIVNGPANGASTLSPLGAGAGTTASSNSGAGSESTDWKARAKNAEREADRNAKELEIARWRLVVLEEEQRTNEAENQEALKALAARAMRAEARIKLLEDARKAAASESSPSPSPAAASPVAAQEMALPNGSSANEGGGGSEDLKLAPIAPGQGVHPLAWLDLDSVSFSTRPLNPTRPPMPGSTPSSSGRKRSGRNSHGSSSNDHRRRQQGGGGGGGGGGSGGRRRSSNTPSPYPPPSPSLHLSGFPMTTATEADEGLLTGGEEDDIVIVLDAPRRKTSGPSRRDSYALSIRQSTGGGGEGGGDEDVSGDVSLFVDEDEFNPVEFDSDPNQGHDRLGVPRHPGGNGGISSSESQNGSVQGDAMPSSSTEGLPDYVGFLPGFLLRSKPDTDPTVDVTPARLSTTDDASESTDGDDLPTGLDPSDRTVERDDGEPTICANSTVPLAPLHTTPPTSPRPSDHLTVPDASPSSRAFEEEEGEPNQVSRPSPTEIALPPSPARSAPSVHPSPAASPAPAFITSSA
ncbi:hypothetical protein JCM10212_000425 [Sporobolomyces blumeae]